MIVNRMEAPPSNINSSNMMVNNNSGGGSSMGRSGSDHHHVQNHQQRQQQFSQPPQQHQQPPQFVSPGPPAPGGSSYLQNPRTLNFNQVPSRTYLNPVNPNNNQGFHPNTNINLNANNSIQNSNDPNNNMNGETQEAQNQLESPEGVAGSERRNFFEEIRNGGGHWSQLLRQVILTSQVKVGSGAQGGSNLSQGRRRASRAELEDGDDPNNISMGGGGSSITSPVSTSSPGSSSSPMVPLQVLGGSENGHFAYVGHLGNELSGWISVGYLQPGDIILDIQGQQVAGYTQADVLSLLHHCLQANAVTLTVAPRGSLGPELRSYLNTRFQKGSVDHALQGVVRDNLYLRTVPVTTRAPRPGEIPRVDYTFLSVEEFMELERNGSLLESGVYAGNHYGTPKPWASRLRNANSQMGNGDEMTSVDGENTKNPMLPGMHPSSEGKRRRNRSNVEALGAGTADDDSGGTSTQNVNSPTMTSPITYSSRPVAASDELGPLPNNWEMSYTEKGEVYFIDHNTGTSHWLDPRLSRVQKLSLEDCADNELPYGWEQIDDPHYGTYYIDHVNRRTQFDNPVIQAKQSKSNLNASWTAESEKGSPPRDESKPVPNKIPPKAPPKPTSYLQQRLASSISHGKSSGDLVNDQGASSHQIMNPHSLMPNLNSNSISIRETSGERSVFTRDPEQLAGERIYSALLKSSRGLGFTIVGGDDDDGLDEFLQIKSVVADGPAWREGKLRTGDVLVRVNNRCVLGYTHQEMVSIFQSISPGEEVHLEVCRGYPLPFDPADPNTEIVTTVAVAPLSSGESGDKRIGTPDSIAHSAHSLPELTVDRLLYGKFNNARPASVDLLLDSPEELKNEKGFGKQFDPGMFLTIGIIKGAGGFGFTIADSVTGQKVKKVLDASHCGGLEEGDRLIAIDGIDLRGLSHTQVVQVLKEFPLGREVSLTIQRFQQLQMNSYKLNSGVPSHYSDSRLLPQQRQGVRSKTPTADLGRERPRLRDSLPERPKTPLIDSQSNNNGQSMYNGDENIHSFTNSHSYFTGSVNVNHRDDSSFTKDMNSVPIIRDWIEMTVELQRRQEGFGFRIVGGTEEGSQVSVGHIVPRGAAALDGRLQTNDQLVGVDDVSVVGSSHHSVVQLMSRAASTGRVRLTIRRPIYGSVAPSLEQDSGVGPSESPTIINPIHVTLQRQPSEGFGFVIISSASKAGATIGRIVDGSPADRCGQLRVGDRILAVNQIDISQLHHSQVVHLIKDSGLSLTLTVVASGQNGQTYIPQTMKMSPSMNSNLVTADMENLSLKASHSYDIETSFISPENHPEHFSQGNLGNSYMESTEQIFAVQLNRGTRGFGFSIRGGKEFQNMPLFVLRLAEDGPATQDARMQVGDQILQINGISTHGMTHSQAIHIIKTGGATVHLLLRRGAVPFPFLNQVPNFSQESVNGQEEEQSLSSSNDPQFISQNSPIYRDHRSLYPPPT